MGAPYMGCMIGVLHMEKYIVKFIKINEIDFGDQNKNEEYYNSLKLLITILFSVVFGVGLSELKGFKFNYDGLVLLTAYIAILFSWWGYHRGTIIGPRETNRLNYYIDVFLIVVVYSLLIYKRDPLWLVLFLYVLMFTSYIFWELIRLYGKEKPKQQEEMIRKATVKNICAWILILVVFIASFILKEICSSFYFVILLLFLFGYRMFMHRVYAAPSQEKYKVAMIEKVSNDELLINEARSVAEKSMAKLSKFKVGAAILADSNKIYVGCNIEFENYSNTIHAEESAISAFIAAGEKQPISIAVFTFGKAIAFPCGKCCQSLFELGGNELKIIACNEITYEIKTIGELLPYGFHL